MKGQTTFMLKMQKQVPAPVNIVHTGPGAAKKIGIVGSHARTLLDAPWADPTWEFWAHAAATTVIPANRVSMFFDLHPPHCFRQGRKNGFENYYEWLKVQPTPIWMQRAYKEIRQAVEFPYDEIKAAWPQLEFHSQTAFMIACAVARGATHVGVWGCEYSHDSEYRFQRGNCQLALGLALGRGVQVTISRHSTLFKEFGDYAYETHRTPEKMQEWVKLCGWDKRKEKNAAPLGQMTGAQTPADFAAAAAKRAQDPLWRKAMAQLNREEPSDRPADMPAPALDVTETAAPAAALA